MGSKRVSSMICVAVLSAGTWTACDDETKVLTNGNNEPPPTMEYDPHTDPPRVPRPTIELIDRETGLIDFSLAGIDVPPDCSVLDQTEVARCEYCQYLERLDGFPTLSTAMAPFSHPLDMSTATIPGDVFVLDGAGRALGSDALDLRFHTNTNHLVITPVEGWNTRTTYIAAVRGYDNGVRTVDGEPVQASRYFELLKLQESLTCGAPTPAELDPECQYYRELADRMDSGEAIQTLFTLERLRRSYDDEGVFMALELFGEMPREELAGFWVFPTHSGPAAELDPERGMLPQVVSDTEIRIPVKGSLDALSLVFSSVNPQNATVLLLNLTALEGGDIVAGMPAFDGSYHEPYVSMAVNDPFIQDDLYCVILTDGITDDSGRALVPSPVTVFLRARGPLVDGTGASQIDVLEDSEAAELEEGRLRLANLLDSPTFVVLTGLTREEIAYVWVFTFPDPATAD